METCSRCNGECSRPSLDPLEKARDVCYHCEGTGKVDDDTAFDDRVGALAERLARFEVAKRRAACNADPHGEGWDFHAAENMQTPADFTQECEMAATDRIMRNFAELDRATLSILLDAIANLDQRAK